MAWTNERVVQLKKLWIEGYSASQIATHLGDTTRNAVIGKIHRLGLSARNKNRDNIQKIKGKRINLEQKKTEKQTLESRKKIKEKTNFKQYALHPKKLSNGEYATVLTLVEYMCKWPVGDPDNKNFLFCGRKTVEGLPYCEAHTELAYQPKFKKKIRNRISKKRA